MSLTATNRSERCEVSENVILGRVGFALERAKTEEHPEHRGVSTDMYHFYTHWKCRSKQLADTFFSEQSKLYSKLFPALAEKFTVALCPVSEADTKAVLEVGLQQLERIIITGADQHSRMLLPLREDGGLPMQEWYTKLVVQPGYNLIKATKEVNPFMRLQYVHQEPSGKEVILGGRYVVSGRHYGREEAVIRWDKHQQSS